MGVTCSRASDCEEEPAHQPVPRSQTANAAAAPLPAPTPLHLGLSAVTIAVPARTLSGSHVAMGATPSSALAASSIIKQRQEAAAAADASRAAAADPSSHSAYTLLIPTGVAASSLDSAVVVDLREAAHKGTTFAGTNTSRLQLFPPPADFEPSLQSSPVSAPPPHPLVQPALDSARRCSEVEFVRSMIPQLYAGSGGEWEIHSLHRLFNAEWLAQFQTRQKSLNPSLFHSSPGAGAGHGSLSQHQLPSAVLLPLQKFSNDNPAGVPVFAWHGTKTEASLPSILKLGLSTAFSVRGGRNIFVSQDFSHSITYCLDHCGHLAKPKHLFLCIVLRTQEEIDTCTVAAYRSGQAAPPPTFHALAVPDQRRVMPIYHVAVKFVPKTMPTNGAQ